MAPLPNTRLFHTRFEGHHRAVADRQLTAECVITRPAPAGTPAFDETTGTSTHLPAATIYSGPCRVKGPARDPATATAVIVGDREQHIGAYTVVIPATAALIQAGDLIEVTANAGDTALVGLRLQVTGAQRGSITWQRDIACQLSMPTTR